MMNKGSVFVRSVSMHGTVCMYMIGDVPLELTHARQVMSCSTVFPPLQASYHQFP